MGRRARPTPRAGTAIAYRRVSTREQSDNGCSLDAQDASIRRYAEMNGLELVEVLVDAGVSASIPLAERPGGARLVEMVERGEVACVIAMKLDRLFRDALDALAVTRRWDERGIALHLVDQKLDTSSAVGRLFITMLAAVAEMERNLIGERTAAALRHLQREGVVLGGEPLGWKRTSERDEHGRLGIAKDDSERAIVERIVLLRRAGTTLTGIAEALTRAGTPTKCGGRWYASTVRAVLQRVERERGGLLAA